MPLSPILVAGLTGFVSGLLLSIPIGPINLTIVNEGARRGFLWAALIGLGATVMEIIYCFIAFTSLAALFTDGFTRFLEAGSVVFMLYLGIKFLLAKSPQPVPFGTAAARFEARLEQRLQPHSAFMTGLVRVMGNLGVLAFWVVLATNFISRNLVRPDWPGKCACVAGVGLGTGLWFLALSWLVSLGKGKFSERTMLKMQRVSGIILVAIGLVNGCFILWKLYHPAQPPSALLSTLIHPLT
jgi:threonine/homoserine/homoserine lactone efflux protein